MRFPRMIHLATTRAAAALAALFLVAAPAAAQSLIDIPAETATARAGKWVVTTDSTASGGQRTMRHPDQGASKITTARSSPTDYFEVTFSASAGVPYQLAHAGQGRPELLGQRLGFRAVLGQRHLLGLVAVAHRHDLGDRSESRGLQRLRPLRLEVAGQRLRHERRRRARLLRDHRHAADAHPDARRRPVDRPDPVDSRSRPTRYADDDPPLPSSVLKVLDWNTHHGIGTDGRYDIARFIPYIVNSGANVVSLNEVEKNVGAYGNEDQPARYAALLRTATGKTWYYNFAQRDGNTNGQGNLILTTFAIEDSDGLSAQLLALGGAHRRFWSTASASTSSRRTWTPIRAAAARRRCAS